MPREDSLASELLSRINTELVDARRKYIESLQRVEEVLRSSAEYKNIGSNRKNSSKENSYGEATITDRFLKDKNTVLDRSFNKYLANLTATLNAETKSMPDGPEKKEALARNSKTLKELRELASDLSTQSNLYSSLSESNRNIITPSELQVFLDDPKCKEHKAAVKIKAKLDEVMQSPINAYYSECKQMAEVSLNAYDEYKNNSAVAGLFARIEQPPATMKQNEETIIRSILNRDNLSSTKPNFQEVDSQIAKATALAANQTNSLINAFSTLKNYAKIDQNVIQPLQSRLNDANTPPEEKEALEKKIEQFNNLITAQNEVGVSGVNNKIIDETKKAASNASPGAELSNNEISRIIAAQTKSLVAELAEFGQQMNQNQMESKTSEQELGPEPQTNEDLSSLQASEESDDDMEYDGPQIHIDMNEEMQAIFEMDNASEITLPEVTQDERVAMETIQEADVNNDEAVSIRIHH